MTEIAKSPPTNDELELPEYRPGKTPSTETPVTRVPAETRLAKIAEILQLRKAGNLRVLNLRKVNNYLEYFVIATGTSDTHIVALSRDVAKLMRSFKDRQINRIESREKGWLVLDFTDIVIHLFTQETRSYYNLERLWGDAEDITAVFLSPKTPPAEHVP